MNKALFLDRDGVINRLVKYSYGWDSPQKPQDIGLVNDIEKIIAWANQQKIPVVEISNQPGVAKGKMSQQTSDAIESKVHQLLKQKNAIIDKTYICPHHPNAVVQKFKKNCDCRKPKPGLLLRAAKQLNIDLSKSIFVGDSATDTEAANAVGVKSLIFLHGKDVPKKVKTANLASADYRASSMDQALLAIKDYFKSK